MKGIRPDRIKALRERRGLTKTQLAAMCNITEQYMYKIESDDPPNLGSSSVVAMAYALETSTDFLLGVTDDPEPPKPAVDQSDPHIREIARNVQGKLEELQKVAPYLLDSATNLLYTQLALYLAAVEQTEKVREN